MIKVSNEGTMIIGDGETIFNEVISLETKILKKVKDTFGEEATLEALNMISDMVKEPLEI